MIGAIQSAVAQLSLFRGSKTKTPRMGPGILAREIAGPRALSRYPDIAAEVVTARDSVTSWRLVDARNLGRYLLFRRSVANGNEDAFDSVYRHT